MKKIMIGGAMFVLIAQYAQASGSDESLSKGLIGAEVGGMHIDAKNDLGISFDDTYSAGAIKIGAENDSWRFLAQYNIIENGHDNGVKVSNDLYTVHLDYLVTSWRKGEWSTMPFIGVNGGYLSYHYGSSKENGFAGGAEAGMILSKKSFEMEVGIRYLDTNVNLVDSLTSVYVGFNFKVDSE